MIKITGYVMAFAPIAVFAAMAAIVTTQGLGILVTYGKFMGGSTSRLGLLWALCSPPAFCSSATRCSGSVDDPRAHAASPSRRQARSGVSENARATGTFRRAEPDRELVLPLGYSFNLDGSMMYCTFATLFIAQAYNIRSIWVSRSRCC